MVWEIEWDDKARKEFLKLDKQAQRKIIDYLDARIASGVDPQSVDKPLRGNLAGLWRYRVGDYRVICQIVRQRIVVIVLSVAHRRHVYEK